MRVSKCLGLLAIGLLLGGTALAGVPNVYVSYPNSGVYSWVPGSNVLIEKTNVLGYEDLVVDPENNWIGCMPDGADGFQCGWYTQYGDRIVTQKNGSSVYVYPADQANYPGSYFLIDLGSTGLEGVTQAANGDLLVVDRAGERVIRVPFDVNAQYPYGDALGWFDTDPLAIELDFLTGLTDPVGIARSSRGDVFVSTDDGVISLVEIFVDDPDDPEYPKCKNPNKPEYPCDQISAGFAIDECPTLDLHQSGRPYFLEFDADDVLYIAATDRASSKLFKYEHYPAGSCDAGEPLFDIPDGTDEGEIPLPLVGLAVPYGDEVLGKRATSLGGLDIPAEVQIQNFYDHAYEFRFEPYPVLPEAPAGRINDDGYCAVEIRALEVEPGVLDDLLESIPIPDTNPTLNVTGEPVLYAGENGRGIAYEVVPFGYLPPDPEFPENGPVDKGDFDCYSEVEGELLFRHSINAFTGYVPNPRIVRCDHIDTVAGGNNCSLIPLNTYYPFNGIFPDDGRITGTRGSTPADFSWYFLADVDLEDNDNGNGDFCGFESPWFEPLCPGDVPCDWTNSNILDEFVDNYETAFPAFSTTESVPFKFYIADLEADPDPGNCTSGPYIDGATVLMSVARVRDENYQVLDPFEPFLLTAAGGSALFDPAIFNEAGLPTTQYHFNAKFTNAKPGIYQLVLVPLTNNFAAEIRYVRVYTE